MTQFWDQQFSAPGYKYGTQPNAFLVEQSRQFSAGSDVLLPGDGEGRNSVWLAVSGHRATALDSSAIGLSKASDLASKCNVVIQTLHADLNNWTAPHSCFDAIVLTYLHLPAALRQTTHSQLVGSLRPGGYLVLEAFHPKQLGYASGGPKDVSMLYTLETLRADFDIGGNDFLHEAYAWEGEILLDEGPGHHGPAFVTRFVAKRMNSTKPFLNNRHHYELAQQDSFNTTRTQHFPC